MKKTKHLFWILPAMAILTVGGILGSEYYRYQQKQNDVKIFQTYALEGFRLRAMQRPKAAAAAYEKAYAIHKKDAQTLMDMASVYAQLSDNEKAARLYSEAFDADPDRYTALYDAALCDYALGRFNATLEKTRRLLHIDRRRLKYIKLMALAHHGLGHTDKALGYYARLAKIDRYAGDKALRPLKALYDASPEAVPPVEIVFAYETTEEPEALFSLAKRYEAEGFDVKALRCYQKILLAEPGNDRARLGAGKLFKKHDTRAEALEQFLAIKHPDAEALESIGALYHSAKAYQKAMAYYERAYALNKSPELLRAMTAAAFYLKDEARTMRYAAELQQVSPQTAHRLLYAMETAAGMEHSPWQTLRFLARELWYRLTAGEPA